MPGDSEKDAWLETNLLGEDNGFGVFWSGRGLTSLMGMIDTKPELLGEVVIKTDKNETLTITEFLDGIKKLKIRYDR